jgi:capsular polysaccharide export protein
MIARGIHAFRGKGVLLLQGPVGPFFRRLAHDLELAGATVHKVNFNAGDWLFQRQNAFSFRGEMAAWPDWLEALLERLSIDVVLLFGDCRPIHVAAREVAQKRGLEVGVFEEGYLRPHYITFERHGVNGNSQAPRTPGFYLDQPETSRPRPKDLGNTYWHMALWAFLYFTVGSFGRPWFPRYVHHRRLAFAEAWPWARAGWRKLQYGVLERGVLDRLCSQWDKRFFLVPLQVFNDAQVFAHSRFGSVEQFVEEVMASFARHAAADTALVIKHHPMSRGYTDYTSLIRRLERQYSLSGRCFYIHDQHLPTLLKHASGVVVVNSTTGLQALNHQVPVKALGHAIYDIQGLCHQGSLDSFWNDALRFSPDKKLLQRFVSHLIERSQLAGSFYKAWPRTDARADTAWHATAWGDGAEQAAQKPFHPSLPEREAAPLMTEPIPR